MKGLNTLDSQYALNIIYKDMLAALNQSKATREQIDQVCATQREAERWHLKGTQQEHSGQHEFAVESYKQALMCNIDLWPAMYNLSCVCERLGRITATKKWLKRCLRAHPKYIPAFVGLSNCYARLNKFPEATVYIE